MTDLPPLEPSEPFAVATDAAAPSAADGPAVADRGRRRSIRGWITHLRRHPVLSAYLALVVPCGLVLMFSVPPSQFLDETAHFSRVWQITEGNVIAERGDGGAGTTVNVGTYPACVRAYIDGFQTAATLPEPFRWSDFFSAPDGCGDAPPVTLVGEAMGTYSAWSYPGQVIGVGLARIVGAPIPASFYLGRLMGFAVSVALCAAAILRAPRGRLFIAFVALVPMSVMGAVAYSSDGLITGATLLFIAEVLRAVVHRRLDRADVVVIAACLLGLGLSKPPYLVLALLLLCIPGDALGNARRTRAVLAGTVAGLLVAVGLWSVIAVPAGAVLVFRPGVAPGEQISWIVHHPVSFANVLSDTFFGSLNQDLLLKSWMGWFGMGRSGNPDAPYFLTVFGYLSVGGAVLMAVQEMGPRALAPVRVDRVRSLVPYVLVPLTIVGIYVAAYVAWDAPGATSIYGVQGRYFLPFLPVLSVGLVMRHRQSEGAASIRSLVVISLVLWIATFVKIHTYFY